MADPNYRLIKHGSSSEAEPGWSLWTQGAEYINVSVRDSGEVWCVGKLGDVSSGTDNRHGLLELNPDGTRKAEYSVLNSGLTQPATTIYQPKYTISKQGDCQDIAKDDNPDWVYYGANPWYAINRSDVGGSQIIRYSYTLPSSSSEYNLVPVWVPDSWTNVFTSAIDRPLWAVGVNSSTRGFMDIGVQDSGYTGASSLGQFAQADEGGEETTFSIYSANKDRILTKYSDAGTGIEGVIPTQDTNSPSLVGFQADAFSVDLFMIAPFPKHGNLVCYYSSRDWTWFNDDYTGSGDIYTGTGEQIQLPLGIDSVAAAEVNATDWIACVRDISTENGLVFTYFTGLSETDEGQSITVVLKDGLGSETLVDVCLSIGVSKDEKYLYVYQINASYSCLHKINIRDFFELGNTEDNDYFQIKQGSDIALSYSDTVLSPRPTEAVETPTLPSNTSSSSSSVAHSLGALQTYDDLLESRHS